MEPQSCNTPHECAYILRVTTSTDYYLPMMSKVPEVTQINGWTIAKVVRDWFERHLNSDHHATRDSFEIGKSKKLIKYDVLEVESVRQERAQIRDTSQSRKTR